MICIVLCRGMKLWKEMRISLLGNTNLISLAVFSLLLPPKQDMMNYSLSLLCLDAQLIVFWSLISETICFRAYSTPAAGIYEVSEYNSVNKGIIC